MDDAIYYELWVISIATCASAKGYSTKLYAYCKDSLELFFSRIMYVHMLQRLFKTAVEPNTCNFFLGLLRQISCLLNVCGIRLLGA